MKKEDVLPTNTAPPRPVATLLSVQQSVMDTVDEDVVLYIDIAPPSMDLPLDDERAWLDTNFDLDRETSLQESMRIAPPPRSSSLLLGDTFRKNSNCFSTNLPVTLRKSNARSNPTNRQSSNVKSADRSVMTMAVMAAREEVLASAEERRK